MQYRASIAFLQSLITEPEGVFDDGFRNFGWCCSEHSLVFSLALRKCGVSSVIGEGELAICVPGDFLTQDVSPHWFVIANESVYDSSIRFKGIHGIFPDCGLGIPVYLTNDGAQPIHDKHHGVRYTRNCERNPEDFVSVTSPTDYGAWLTSRSIDHKDFWRDASTVTAAILKSSITPPESFSDRLLALEYTVETASIINKKR